MSNPQMNEIVAAAVGEAFRQWAGQHPSLAAVIDQIRLSERTVELLRNSEAYRAAVEAYRRDQRDMALFQDVLGLAAPLVARLLGG